MGDFDGQDHDDLAVLFYDDVNTHGVMRVLLNSGTGDDFEAGDEFEFGTLPSSIEAADLDNTNGPDLAVTDFQEDGRVWLLYNNGDGTFGTPEELDISAATAGWDVFPADLILNDLNGDEATDIAVANQGRFWIFRAMFARTKATGCRLPEGVRSRAQAKNTSLPKALARSLIQRQRPQLLKSWTGLRQIRAVTTRNCLKRIISTSGYP